MVIICASAVTAKFVQFPSQQRIGPSVILDRIEDGDSIGSQSNCTTKEMGLGRQRVLRDDRFERNSPSIVAKVGLRQRHLLLPSGNSYHHSMIRHRIRLDIEKSTVLTIFQHV